MSLAKRNEKVRTEQKRLMAQFSDIPPNKKKFSLWIDSSSSKITSGAE